MNWKEVLQMDAETASKNKKLKKNEIDKKAWQHSPPQ